MSEAAAVEVMEAAAIGPAATARVWMAAAGPAPGPDPATSSAFARAAAR